MTYSTEPWQAAPDVGFTNDELRQWTQLCVKNSEYDYTSGGHGGEYVDYDHFFAETPEEPIIERTLIEAVRKIVALRDRDGYDTLAFVESRRGPVGVMAARLALSKSADLKSIVVRPHKRLLSQAVRPFKPLADRRVLIVADVATTGQSIGDTARILWRLGARDCGAFAMADRQQGASEYLSALDITLDSLVYPSAESAVSA